MNKKVYYINKNHKFPFEFEKEIWIRYYPGYEGIYAISTEGNVLSLERKILQVDGKIYPVKQKKLKPLLKGSKENRTLKTFNLYKEESKGKPLSVTINQVLKIIDDVSLTCKI